MTNTRDITPPDVHDSTSTDPLELAHVCLSAATFLANDAAEKRAQGDHSGAGVDREQQRYYLARARMHAEIAKVEALRSIADDLNRLALAR